MTRTLSLVAVAAVVAATLSAVPSATAAVGPTDTPPASAPFDATYQPVTPVRTLDTRLGYGAPKARIGAYQSLEFSVVRKGVAANASAVALHVTVVNPTAAGSIQTRSNGDGDYTSDFNFVAGQRVGNLVLSVVRDGGYVILHNSSPGTVDLVADVEGYWTSGYPTTAGALTPAGFRQVDTRLGQRSPKAPLGPDSTRDFDLRISTSVEYLGLASMNITAINPTQAGSLTVWQTGTPRPATPNLYFTAGQRVANSVTVPSGLPFETNGKISIYNSSPGTVDVTVDIDAEYLPRTAHEAGTLTGVPSTRILDTRSGVGAPKSKAGAYATTKLRVLGRGGIPATNVSAVLLNVTVANQSKAGLVTVWAGDAPKPSTSSLDFPADETTSTLVLAPVAADGTVSLHNSSPGSVDLLADVSGYFFAARPPLTNGPRRSVLIVGTDPGPYGPGRGLGYLHSALNDADYESTFVDTLPADLSSYGQVWDYGGEPKTAAQEAELEAYVNGGGSLLLTGDQTATCTACDDANVQHIVDSLVPSIGGLQIGPYAKRGDANATTQVNPPAIDDLATMPNPLSTFFYSATGSIAANTIPAKNRVFTDPDGNIVVAAWDGADLVGNGRLIVFMNQAWPEGHVVHGDEAHTVFVVENLAYFLSHKLP